MPEPSAQPAESLPQRPAPAESLSAMTPRFNWFFRGFARRYFRHFELGEDTVEKLRELERRGSVVYVMRYASRLDYFLFNWLFLRDELRLSGFANGILFYYYRPLWRALRAALSRRRGVPRVVGRSEDRQQVRDRALAGDSFFLFLRTARIRSLLRTRRGAVKESRADLDLIEELVRTAWGSERPISVVPLALFWRKGPRTERRFLNLSYGALTRPSDLAKVASFLTTYRDLSVKVGDPIDLGAFVEVRRHEGQSAVARKVRRALLIYFYREEKVVEGPTVRSPQRVQETVLEAPRVREAIEQRGRERRGSSAAARAAAERHFREIAANMNSTFLAVLNFISNGIFRRVFASIEVSGLDRVAEYAKLHPLVLVPSHRSYFDFMIVSSLFYSNHLVPPHIAARENMAFGPFGFIFRRVGAFFMRRSFDDPLYKEVFRAYMAYLVKEGFTQEFFIEGGRSRTGKTLAPRLGMVAWNLDAFLATARRDLFFVPIAITYERIVEETAIVGELEGGEKRDESVLALIRARKYLQRRFGSVFMNFGEPISVAEALGDRRARFATDDSAPVEAEKRAFVEALGNQIAERINWAVVANATSVAACALLGEPRRGMLRPELTARMREIVDYLRLQQVQLTPALAHDRGEFHDSIAFLLRSDLIRSVEDPRGEILYFEESRRLALALYRNAIIHYLTAPSFLALRLLSEASSKELRDDLSGWLDLFDREFFVPRGEVLAVHFGALIEHFLRQGYAERENDMLRVTEAGRAHFLFLAEQTRSVVEAYYAAFTAALEIEGPIGDKALLARAAEQFERAQLLGEVGRREASNAVTFGNAIDVLVRRRVLERGAAEADRAKSGETQYTPGAVFGDLPKLRDRLAAALPAR